MIPTNKPRFPGRAAANAHSIPSVISPRVSRRRTFAMFRLMLALAGAALVGLGPAAGAQKKGTGPAALEGVQVLRDLEYVQGGHERNRLDLYLPEKATRPLPVILWVHGGGWSKGDKTNGPAFRFATKGYAVASMNYRFSQHATLPRPDSRLQSRRPLAARQRQEVWSGRGSHRRLGQLGRRPPRGAAGHHGGRQRAGRSGRKRGSIQPRAGRGGLVWPDRLPHGRARRIRAPTCSAAIRNRIRRRP